MDILDNFSNIPYASLELRFTKKDKSLLGPNFPSNKSDIVVWIGLNSVPIYPQLHELYEKYG